MSAAGPTTWVEHALAALSGGGHRRGGARQAVVEFLGHQRCGVTALEIEDGLRDGKRSAGRASIYRALEQLEQLGLVRRLEMGAGIASYERADPGGDHHHHMVCDECGRVIAFEDEGLERAIARLSATQRFDVGSHDVTLRGRCPRCA